MTQPSKSKDKAAAEEAAPTTTTEDTGANPPTNTLEDANEVGYLGYHSDQAPNESYTVQGVGETPDPKKED